MGPSGSCVKSRLLGTRTRKVGRLKYKADKIMKARDDGGLDWGGKKWLDSE